MSDLRKIRYDLAAEEIGPVPGRSGGIDAARTSTAIGPIELSPMPERIFAPLDAEIARRESPDYVRFAKSRDSQAPPERAGQAAVRAQQHGELVGLKLARELLTGADRQLDEWLAQEAGATLVEAADALRALVRMRDELATLRAVRDAADVVARWHAPVDDFQRDLDALRAALQALPAATST